MRLIDGVALGLLAMGCALDTAGLPQEAEEQSALKVDKFRYEGQDVTLGPDGYDYWGPLGVSNHGDVLGVGLTCDDDFIVCTYDLLKLDCRGNFSVVAQNFSPNDVNAKGDAGGCIVEGDLVQAAIVHSNGKLELFVPSLPGETVSCISRLSDGETALVASFDEAFNATEYVRKGNKTYPFSVPGGEVHDINDRGEIAGVLSTDSGDRAFRFDAKKQTTTILEPISTDANSWGLGINQQGEVLGYSFDFNATERIGKWTSKNKFQTSFVEGTPQFPTISNNLIWNEQGLIVISYIPIEGNTYLVPKPGVRLNLADLVVNEPVPSTLFAFSINERGDFLAQSLLDGSVHLYKRLD